MSMLRTLVFILCLFPILAYTAPMRCVEHAFLKNGFSMNDYNQCRALMNKCPASGALPDISCVDKVAAENKVCSQLHQLAQVTNGVLDLIVIEKNDQLLLVDQHFPADGQQHYYIISPKHCIVDTQIDPRDLSQALKNKYQKMELMLVNWEKPVLQTHNDGSQTINSKLKVTDTCLACKIVGYAQLKFDFDKKGVLTKISLEKFSENND